MAHYNSSGYLKAIDGFELHYSSWGNPEGVPILFLHGGPGLGCGPNDVQFFNAENHFVLFLDQRGAPKSKPFGTVEGIEPFVMIDDIIALLDFFKIKKCHVFGGSWGSTLALLFALAHPNMVYSLILRGVFLAHKKGTDAFLDQSNTPDCYLNLLSAIPNNQNQDLLAFYCEKMFSDDINEALYFGRKWDDYAMCLNKSPLNQQFNIEDLYKVRLTAWFAKHYCFLPEDYILSNIDKIKHIPTTIIQGVNDKITPPFMAEELHDTLEQSTLYLEEAGHFASEKLIFERLKQSCNKIK
jgi:proline iminopeptidase